MKEEVILPEMGDGVDSGTVINIMVDVGDTVKEDDTILEVETNKAVLPVPAPFGGSVEKLSCKEGDILKVGDPILVLNVDAAEKKATAPDAPAPAPTKDTSSEKKQEKEEVTAPTPTPSPTVSAPVQPQTAEEKSALLQADFSDIAAAPSARKLARELGIDLRLVTGANRGGRINAQDVKLYVKNQSSSPTATIGQKSRPLPDFSTFGEVKSEPLSNLRKVIADQMNYAWTSIPHVHQTIEIDLEKVSEYQKKHAKSFKEAGSSLSVTLFLMKAMTVCLKEFPSFNSSLDIERDVLWLKNYFHIGVAVDTPAGLIVPVIKNVDEKSIFDLGVELKEIAAKARDRKVTPSDLGGACMTISNLGGLKAGSFTPIVNPPEVAILGVATTKKRLALVDEVVEEKDILPVILGYDHRVIDGANAARFVVRLKELMENPELIFMGAIKK